MSAQPADRLTDLVVLVSDKNMEAVVSALLRRPQSLGIRAVTFDVFVHPRRDPGCLTGAHDFLRPFSGAYCRALVLFDHQGCGRESSSPEALAAEVRAGLEAAGWPGRAEAIVLAPELEIWAWTDSPHVTGCLGWTDRTPPLRAWLAQTGRWPAEDAKPARPKEAFEAALWKVRKPRSSAIYGDLAQKVSLKGHKEPAFLLLSHILKEWFAAP